MSSSSELSVSERVRRLVHDEFRHLQPRMLLATAVSSALPHLRFNFVRTAILRQGGFNIGERSRVMGPLHITGDGDIRSDLKIGADTFISGPLYVDLAAKVSVGSNVYIGHDVRLLTVGHQIGTSEKRCGAHTTGPVTIGDGVWLASRVVVLAGVTIGRGAVVAAGAVVTRDVPPDTLVAGVPARVVRSLDEADEASRFGWREVSTDPPEAFESGTMPIAANQ